MNPNRIVIDGKTYNSVDEMPEDVRRNYEEAMRGVSVAPTNASNPAQMLNNIFADADNNGVPDIMEQHAVNLPGGMTFVVNGQTFNKLEDLPPEARARYEKAMGAIDKNQNGVPDFIEGMVKLTNQSAQPAISTSSPIPQADTTRHASRAPMLSSSSAFAPDTSNGWMLVLGVVFILMICALGAVGVWYFFLR